jgi:EAL domain-containing protein (putative c-di-GMP-specific phosphodiesterase class I)
MARDGRGPEGPRASRARIAVDDLDTGFIWLTALRDLPIDQVTIDLGFIPAGLRTTDRPALAASAIALAHALGLPVVATASRPMSTPPG